MRTQITNPRGMEIRITNAKQWQAICNFRYARARQFYLQGKFREASKAQAEAAEGFIRMQFYRDRVLFAFMIG